MANGNTETVAFSSKSLKEEIIKDILSTTKTALEERGYNYVNQITGYLMSNDPAYISSHKNARSIIQSVERYEIIEELVKSYIEKL